MFTTEAPRTQRGGFLMVHSQEVEWTIVYVPLRDVFYLAASSRQIKTLFSVASVPLW
jgi:hypothetical protein